MDPEVIAIAITSGLAAFTGVIKSLNGFNEKIQRNSINYRMRSIVSKMIWFVAMY